MKPNRIILTGPSGSGKTTAANYLITQGYTIINCDQLAKSLYAKKGDMIFKQIVYCFGKEILDDKGYIDKAKLGELIFNNHRNRKKLNNLIYKSLVLKIYEELKNYRYAVIDMPVYFDCGAPDFSAKVILIDSTMSARVKRLQEKGYSYERAMAQAGSLKFNSYERLFSDLVIKNNSEPEEMIAKLEQWLKQ